MKEMIKRMREERGGFTLAELLIVVAIILVLVAIAVPVFTGALSSANESVAKADIHAVKSQAAAKYLLQGEEGTKYYTATIDAEGNISPLSDAADTGTVTTVDSIKGKVGKESVPITVEIKADDVS